MNHTDSGDPRESEVLVWNHRTFDIARMHRDLREGVLTPALIDLPPRFVATYAQHVLVKSEVGRTGISMEHALFRTSDRLSEPVILLHMGENQGIVTLCDEPISHNYVVGDGNHRLLFAGIHKLVFGLIYSLKATQTSTTSHCQMCTTEQQRNHLTW